MKVLIAPDKFKGRLSAAEVSESLRDGIGDQASIATLPLANGGDGSVDAAVDAGATRHGLIAFDGHTAVVEVANTCGIALLGENLDPLGASTLRLGAAFREAVALGPARIVIAAGGSASTDGGMGLLVALGLRFLDTYGDELAPCGAALVHIKSIDTSGLIDLAGIEIVRAADVDNPLLGHRGAARVFAPQKGATPNQVRELEEGLATLSRVALAAGLDPDGGSATNSGAGAAGGTGYACLLLGGRMVSGAEFFLDLLSFDEVVRDCDVIITGEGCLDEQTASGKLVAVVAARSRGRRVVAVVGRSLIDTSHAVAMGIDHVYTLSSRDSRDSSADSRLSRQLLVQIGREIAATLT